MRFKKLKVSVAIALIAFVLIAGSIISVGFWQNNGIPTNKDNSNQLQLLTPTYSVDTNSGQVSSNQQTGQVNTPQAPTTPQAQQAPVVVRHVSRTRAS